LVLFILIKKIRFSGVGQNEDGTAIYVNGVLAPDLTLQRGKEYTFVVETGLGTDSQETFHPFYITDNTSGGRHIKAEREAQVYMQVYIIVLLLQGAGQVL
jgi:hypothetical protein